MADLTYIGNVGDQIPRNVFVLYVQIAAGEYEPLGWGVEESGVTITIDSETRNDILGNTIVQNRGITEEQVFDPNDIRVGDKLNAMLIDRTRHRSITEFGNFTVLRVWGMFGAPKQYEAEQDTGCTIRPTGDIGGQGTMSMPFTVTMSGKRTFGKTNVFLQTDTEKITFTPNTGA